MVVLFDVSMDDSAIPVALFFRLCESPAGVILPIFPYIILCYCHFEESFYIVSLYIIFVQFPAVANIVIRCQGPKLLIQLLGLKASTMLGSWKH